VSFFSGVEVRLKVLTPFEVRGEVINQPLYMNGRAVNLKRISQGR
jgi:hypothetical protein